ncbi:MAG: ATP-binding cassette domain-containing protein, partial [Deltaproteobacteria bacterium]|nr:ATP-binding cassette domain-containing protein [Deltaproteobacteria bacterium]
MAATPILQVERVSMDFGGLRAVSDCSFTVEEGQIYSLIVPNGAGKSTDFNVISGLYRPTAGTVSFRGRRIDGLRPSKIARGGVGRTFQNLELFRGMT